MPHIFLFCFLALFLLGCSSIPPADEGFVSSIIASKINSDVEWYQGCEPTESINQLIQSRLQNELTADEAIQIALWNNKSIQSTFESLGIARAALIEAGLFSNPSFELELRYPKRIGLVTNIEYLITTSVLDIILIPLRTKLAAIEFEQTKLKVTKEILSLAFEVRQSYYELMISNQTMSLTQSLVDLVNINTTIAHRQHQINNISSYDILKIETKCLETQFKLTQVQIENVRLKEKLNILLGFNRELCLNVSNNLPDNNDYECFNLESLEAIACKERLEFKIAYLEIERLSNMLGMKEWWNYTNFQAGVSGERDPDGVNTIGPGFAAEIPIFNYGQAARLTIYSQLRQAQNDLASLETRILSEVREAYEVLVRYGTLINNYRTKLFPLQKEFLFSAEALYNVSGLGIDKLLENKEQEIMLRHSYLEATKNYLIARINLDRALGGYLTCLCSVQL